MFDDLNQNSTPTNTPAEDIFNELEPAGDQIQSPVSGVPVVPEVSAGTFSPQTWWRSWTIGIIIIIVLLVVLLGAYWWWQSGTSKITPVNVASPQPVEQLELMPASVLTPTDTNTTPPTDSDGDGLSDTEEQSLNIDPAKADTDSDGLFDREEVKVYKTDPIKADTDSDGFADGVEVQNGYNPSGTGKLLQLP